ncbi:MAG: hypothetical protein KJO44_10880, partial [Gemmatimonadetes bacterium]|nr:hypothetical protein [Gemmatimonadota bacterium]
MARIQLFKDPVADTCRYKLADLFAPGALSEDTEVEVRRMGHPRCRPHYLEFMRSPAMREGLERLREARPDEVTPEPVPDADAETVTEKQVAEVLADPDMLDVI